MRSVKKLWRDRRGQALVELALALPLLLLVLMGTMECGRIFHAYLVITNASREGARAGVTGAPDSEIREKVKEAAASLGLTDAQISIAPDESVRERGVPLTVRVDYSLALVAPVLDGIVTNPYPLSATTTMRVE